MCGICGFVNLTAEKADQNLVQKMVSIIRHRGPDDQGVYVDRNAGLGHARLSIMDLSSSGHQPMSSQSGRFWIVFNGEIYNYKELQQDLRARGYDFRSNSDTEVLVNLWQEYGTGAISRIAGMFAFAVWDSHSEELFLVRDRLGQKPLFYAQQNGRFYFASEIKSMLQDPDFTVSANLLSIQNYLAYQSIPAPQSAFNDINKLPAGYYLKLDKEGNVTRKRYWQLSYARQYENIAEDELEEIIITELKEAVKKRLMSDVPLGAFLSGGVDSSLVVALMSEMTASQVKTFSIGFNEKTHDETAYARIVADKYNTEHHEFRVTPDAASIFSDLVWHYNEPFADSSAVPTYYLAKMASEYVTVALTGDAGDENFGGYNRYYFPWGVGHAADSDSSLHELVPWFSAVAADRNFSGNGDFAGLDYYTYLFYKRFVNWNEEWLFKLLRPQFWRETGYKLPITYLLNSFNECDSSCFFDKCTYFDLQHYIPDTLMTKIDIAAMAFSLEARSPMLDHNFVEMAARIPSHFKTRGGTDIKYILKKVAERYLPHEVIYRDKMGFGVPIGDWFRGELKEMMYDVLLSQTARNRGYFNSAYVEQVLDMHVAGTDKHYLIWTLLMLEEWHKMFIDKSIVAEGVTAMPWQVGKTELSESCNISETILTDLNNNGTEIFFIPKDQIIKGEGEYEYCFDITSLVENDSMQHDKWFVLYEYFVPLGYPQADSLEIGKYGRGRYRQVEGWVYFSTSDNSDPRSNRHCYTFTLSESAYEDFGSLNC